jgi:hypothetical protein
VFAKDSSSERRRIAYATKATAKQRRRQRRDKHQGKSAGKMPALRNKGNSNDKGKGAALAGAGYDRRASCLRAVLAGL